MECKDISIFLMIINNYVKIVLKNLLSNTHQNKKKCSQLKKN